MSRMALDLIDSRKNPVNSLLDPGPILTVITPSKSQTDKTKVNQAIGLDKFSKLLMSHILHIRPTPPPSFLMRPNNAIEITLDHKRNPLINQTRYLQS